MSLNCQAMDSGVDAAGQPPVADDATTSTHGSGHPVQSFGGGPTSEERALSPIAVDRQVLAGYGVTGHARKPTNAAGVSSGTSTLARQVINAGSLLGGTVVLVDSDPGPPRVPASTHREVAGQRVDSRPAITGSPFSLPCSVLSRHGMRRENLIVNLVRLLNECESRKVP